jgi:hypothetical protein
MLNSHIIEGNPKPHARNKGVGGELEAALNWALRLPHFSNTDEVLAADVHFMNKGVAAPSLNRRSLILLASLSIH